MEQDEADYASLTDWGFFKQWYKQPKTRHGYA